MNKLIRKFAFAKKRIAMFLCFSVIAFFSFGVIAENPSRNSLEGYYDIDLVQQINLDDTIIRAGDAIDTLVAFFNPRLADKGGEFIMVIGSLTSISSSSDSVEIQVIIESYPSADSSTPTTIDTLDTLVVSAGEAFVLPFNQSGRVFGTRFKIILAAGAGHDASDGLVYNRIEIYRRRIIGMEKSWR